MRKRKVYDNKGKMIGYEEGKRINWKTLVIKVNSRIEEDLYDDIKFSRIVKVCGIILPKEKELFEDEIEIYINDVIKELEEE